MNLLQTKLTITAICCSILLGACSQRIDNKDVSTVAIFGNDTLYYDDVMSLMPSMTDSVDSLNFVREYVQNWCEDKLLYAEAVNVVGKSVAVEQQIQKYREQLYAHYYKEHYLYFDFSYDVDEQEISDYYDEHLSDYALQTVFVKAHYLTMDAEVSRYYEEWEKIRKSSLNDEQMLNEYCVGTSRKVCFLKEWTKLSDLTNTINCPAEITDNQLLNNDVTTFVDGNLRYHVKIDSVLNVNDAIPLEIIKNDIVKIIIDNKKNNILIQKIEELKDKALSSNTLKINSIYE